MDKENLFIALVFYGLLCIIFCFNPRTRVGCDDFKLFKPFLQSRERGDLILVFVIHCSINCYDNQTKNHCSERDPPRPRSEHKFYGTSLLIDSYATIYIHRRLRSCLKFFLRTFEIGFRAGFCRFLRRIAALFYDKNGGNMPE